jgi:hypothetical protein
MILNCRFFRKDIAHSVDQLHRTQEVRLMKKLFSEKSNLDINEGVGVDDDDNDKKEHVFL